jgi:hypothetical protein
LFVSNNLQYLEKFIMVYEREPNDPDKMDLP